MKKARFVIFGSKDWTRFTCLRISKIDMFAVTDDDYKFSGELAKWNGDICNVTFAVAAFSGRPAGIIHVSRKTAKLLREIISANGEISTGLASKIKEDAFLKYEKNSIIVKSVNDIDVENGGSGADELKLLTVKIDKSDKPDKTSR